MFQKLAVMMTRADNPSARTTFTACAWAEDVGLSYNHKATNRFMVRAGANRKQGINSYMVTFSHQLLIWEKVVGILFFFIYFFKIDIKYRAMYNITRGKNETHLSIECFLSYINKALPCYSDNDKIDKLSSKYSWLISGMGFFSQVNTDLLLHYAFCVTLVLKIYICNNVLSDIFPTRLSLSRILLFAFLFARVFSFLKQLENP